MLENKINRIVEELGNIKLTPIYGTPLSDIIGTKINEDLLINNYADEIATAASKDFHLYVKVAGEYIPELINKVDKELSKIRPVNEYKIIKFKPNDVMKDIIEFGNQLYKDIPIIDSKIVMPNYDNSFLDRYFKPTLNSTGLHMGNFINYVPAKDVKEIWDRYIAGTSINIKNYNRLALFKNIINKNGYDIVILYILLSNILKDMPDGINGTRSGFNNTITGAIGFTQRTIEQIANKYVKYVEHERIIFELDGKTLILTSDVYDKYIKEGGDINVLLGSINDGNVSIEKLKVNKDKYLENYEKEKTSKLIDARIEKVKLSIPTYINTFTSFIKDNIIYSKYNDNTIGDAIYKMLNSKNGNELLDINSIVIEFLTNIAYNNTNVKFIIDNMKSYTKSGLSPDKAITYVVIEYITKYILNMIKVEKT